MMYEAYEKKVRGYLPAARIFKICVKCAIVLLIVAAVALLGYLSLRGIYFGEFALQSETVAFGDKPDYGCFVLFGTYQCEYADLDSEEWVKEQPTLPGNYRVRAVITKGFFGKQEYSEPGVVTLYRREVTLVPSGKFGASVPYGEEPIFGTHWEIPSSLLAKGHRVEEAKLYKYSYDGSGNVVCHISVPSVVIRDSRGNDVTAGYSLNESKGSVKVKARQLTVVVSQEIVGGKPVDITKTYDGLNSTTTNYQITSGELLQSQGDRIIISPVGEAINAGRYENKVNIRIHNHYGMDATAYYNIKINTCKIIINKRPLKVSTPDVALEYTGQVMYTDQYYIESGNIPRRHTVTLQHNEKTGITDVTSRPTENRVLLQIQNEFGIDVTANYDISYTYGSLTVNPRPLHVRTRDSRGLTYNGEAQSYTAYDIIRGSLGYNHYLSPQNAASLTEPGSCENRVEYRVLSGDGADVTKNYALRVDYGTLTVATGGASVTFGLKELSKTYDSKPLDPDDFQIESLISVLAGGLCANDYVEITGTRGEQTEAGSSSYTVSYRIMHKSSALSAAVDATSWYTSSIASDGILTVTPRVLTIKFSPITKQYDGVAAQPKAPDLTEKTIAGFADGGHKIVLAPGAMQALEYRLNGLPAAQAIGSGSYTYSIPQEYISVVTCDGSQADRTANYSFEFSGNTIQVTGISLLLRAPGASKEYDGKPLSADMFSTSDVEVVWGDSGYSVTYLLTGSQTDAGTGTVGFSNIVVRNARGADVTTNFDIQTETGKLTVTPISIEVRSSSGSKVYDGLPMENATKMTLISGKLIAGHVLGGSIGSDYVTDVGTHDNNKVSPKVYSATGQDVTRNYMILVRPGRYTVSVAPLQIEAPVVTGEYAGIPYAGVCDATAYAVGLARGQLVELDVESDGIALGLHPMKITGYRVLDARGADKTANYDVSYTPGTIEIVPRKIVLKTGNSILPYEMAPAVNTYITVAGSGLLHGHLVRAEFTYPEGLSQVGSVPNSLESYKIVDQNGKDVTELYEISTNYGTLRIKPIEITLETGSAYKETYDAMPISANHYDMTKGAILMGHAIHVGFVYENGISDVGKWKNEFSLIRFTNANGEDVTYMYDVTVIAGVLEIANPFPVQMMSYSAEKVYDGTPLENSTYEQLSDLLPGHSIDRVIPVTLERAGSVENRLRPVILDSEGWDVTRNYEFVYEQGNLGILTVTRRPMTVTLGQTELAYNGTVKLTVPQAQLTYDGLVSGERLLQTVIVSSPEIGEKETAQVGDLRVYNTSGRDVTDCYDIVLLADGLQVTVVQAELKLYLPARYSKEYDGIGADAMMAGYRAMGLANGHSVVYTASQASAEPGTYTIEFLEYTVFDQNGNDVTANYAITPYTCSVQIFEKTIRLTSKSASRHYNGQALFCHALMPYTLTGGFTVEATFTGEQTEVGTSENLFTVKVFDAQGNDVTAYCNIHYIYGTLEIWDQIELVLSSGSARKIFDGNALICHEISDYTLPQGYTLDILFTGEQTQPGISDNTFEVIVYDPNGEDVTTSFYIRCEFGTLEVLASAADWVLTLTSKSASKAYDGTALRCTELEPFELPEGFELEVFFTGEQTALGSSENTFRARAFNALGQELTVVCEFGMLEVNLDIVVNAYEMTFTYDGTEKNCEDVWVQGLPEGFTVDVTFGAGLTLTGSKNVEITEVIVRNEFGQDVTALCDLTVNTARLTVLPRTLTVYVYGQSADSIEPVQGSLVEGHTMFAEYGEQGECFIEITDRNGTLVYSNKGDSPVKNVLYDVIIQYG